ncbi:phosphoadenosine phosphosulfate reductase [Rhizobiales bacterium GAS191]|jgi:phosphoadenosine phosphosulfate reductase|nr:phosphoadenosine phosphosulfate reductase [Rhizobiales bacterium GAS113]SED67196.1 phosphoadenosine phosphosulfate reductase [Rhizobiales bacterium GAS191]
MAQASQGELALQVASAFAASPDLVGRLRCLVDLAPSPAVFTTSFGLEDQVLTHVIARARLPVEFVTLDTGRLFPETVAVWARTEQAYGIAVRAVLPDAASTEALLARDGVEGFKASVEARLACCHVRKVVPLARALAGAGTWITGLRASQSRSRGALVFAEWDEAHGVLKANPLADWTREAVAAFAAEHAIPVNELHAKGFASIGCAPCTRALAPGEPERAGRWWWEEEGKQECGLHLPLRRKPELVSA